MPKMHINRSVKINKPAAEVFQILNDFHTWSTWSPWLIGDPEAKVTVQPDGKYYEWTGPVTGDGNMKITNESNTERLDMDLTFLKPWKSEAKVWFVLKEENGVTTVNWLMDSKLPFFLFMLKKLFVAMISSDYDRGLNMLKEYAEEGKVHSKVTFKANHTFKGGDYVGIKTKTTIDQIGSAMEKDYTFLMEYVKGNHADKVAGNPFSIYHKWDFVGRNVEYTACIPVKGDVPLKGNMFRANHPEVKVYTAHHKGHYGHSGNAWSAMYQRKQNKIFKANKKIDPIEEYLNSPKEVAPNDLESMVHFAVK